MAGDVGSTSLGDLCDPDRGITYGIVKVGDFVSDGVPVIRGGDIRNGRIQIDHEKRVSTEVSQQFQRTILRGGELVINLIAEPGHTAIVPPELAGSNVSRDVGVIPLNTSVDHRYVDYCLKSPMAIRWLASRLQGSVTQKINLATLRDVPIPTPPLAQQRAIAHILGTLDDKIELNRRMSETLEAMARALFKSWFVDFDSVRAKAEGRDPGLPKPLADLFPARLVDSELGEIPEGWEVAPLSNLTTVITKGTTATQIDVETAPQDDPPVRYIRVNALDEDGEVLFDKLTTIPETVHLGVLKRSILLAGDVLYTIAGTIGRVSIVGQSLLPANTNQAVAVIRPRSNVSSAFLALAMRQEAFREELHSNIVHAVQANLSLGMLSRARLAIPPEAVFSKLFAPCDALVGKVALARAQSRTLRTLRDTLLPKLISGELQAKSAENFVGSVD